MLWKNKGVGRKRCVRRSFSTNKNYEDKLKLLSNSCEFAFLTLGSIIVSELLDSESFIYLVQKYHNTNEHYWVTVEKDEKKNIVYRLKDTSQERRTIQPLKSKFLNFRRDIQLKFSFTNDHDLKLSLLSTSCNLSKGELIALILHYSLDSSTIIMYFQERYNIHRHYWVTPLQENGQVSYLLMS